MKIVQVSREFPLSQEELRRLLEPLELDVDALPPENGYQDFQVVRKGTSDPVVFWHEKEVRAALSELADAEVEG